MPEGPQNIVTDMMANEVRFYEASHPFSNFYLSPMVIDCLAYPTVEHYYQSQKFAHDPEYRDLIRLSSTPNKAKILARQRVGGGYKWRTDMNATITEHAKRVSIRADWEQVKEPIMLFALRVKFGQHPSLLKTLIATGTSRLVEASSTDSYWGWGQDRQGLNRLGELLMRVRSDNL